MALLYIKTVEPNSLLGMWEIDADIEVIATQTELSEHSEIKTLKRKKEFITTRLLMDAMYAGAEIKYLPSGKPYLATHDYNISISHSKNRVCILLNRIDSVGIDIQFATPKIVRLKEKFLSEVELSTLNTSTQIDALHFYWCAKEAMYKLFGKEYIDFKKHLAIQAFKVATEGYLTGTIKFNNQHLEITLCYEKMHDYYLVYTIAAVTVKQ